MKPRRILAVTRHTELQKMLNEYCSELFVADCLDEALEITTAVTPTLAVFDTCTPDDIRRFNRITAKQNIDVTLLAVLGDSPFTKQDFLSAGTKAILADVTDTATLENIMNEITSREQTTPNQFFAAEYAQRFHIAGTSRATQNTLKMIRIVAASRCNPVLIVGETGTGKELAARAVHTLRHPEKPFVAVNCAALTANLLESELFGHVKGAFTSADRDKTGLLEIAANGTLLLDEISEMSPDLQAKLLRVLQENTFRRVGGTTNITCKATIIASSNRNLAKEVQGKRFRSDLYYRLNVCPISIAPLRQKSRKADIPLLATWFLQNSRICPEKKGKFTAFTKLALAELEKHDWPGNVRELKNVIERAILLEENDKIGLDSIIFNPEHTDPEENSTSRIKEFSLSHAEKELIARALQETGWQKTRAASLLGITRATLYAKVKQYDINQQTYPPKKQITPPQLTTT